MALDIHLTALDGAPLPSATVMLLRDAPAGLEVLMMRRHGDSAELGGVYVFPGGKLDPADLGAPAQHLDVRDRLPLLQSSNDLDAEAVTLVPGLAEDLRIDDLISSGWVIEGPTQINSGGLRVILRYAFESPAEATTAMRQINGPNGPLLNPELKRTIDGRTVSTTLDATLQFVGGIEAFSDPTLSATIGVAPWAATAEKLGVDLTQSGVDSHQHACVIGKTLLSR